MPRLAELAAEISSKNAGAFCLTFDIVFDTRERYEQVKRAGVISAERIAELYGIAFKIAVRRERPSGSVGETDVFGAQQYAPLLDIEIP
jgi:hypothetical protein